MSLLRSGLAALALGGSLLAHAGEKVVSVVATGPKHVDAGKSFTVRVLVSVKQGYHVYGHNKVDVGVPIAISLAKSDSFAIKSIHWPATKTYKALGESVPVYTGTTTFLVTLVPKKTAKGSLPVPIVVKTQACSDRICLPPTSDSPSFKIHVGA